MIKYNLNNINKWYLGDGNPIAKMYHGTTVAYDVTGGGEPTPSFDGKWLTTYSDSHTESATCDSTSAITSGEINKTNLVSVEIGNCVTNISSSAFTYCYGLTSIDIPDSVTTIGDNAFWSCSGLTSIDIPDSVTTIGSSAFTNCYGLTSCTIGSGVTSIGYDAFANCSGLTSVTIPDSVTNIKSYTFVNCKSLTSVTIGSDVQGIGGYAFNGCSSLTSITILRERSVVNLWDISAFNNTNNCPIYVPANLVDSYKRAYNWKNLASRIKAIPT